MSITLAILQKIKNLHAQYESGQGKYSVAIAPFAHTLSNLDFKFLSPEIIGTATAAAEYYDEQLEFATISNSITKNPNVWQIDTQALMYNIYKDILRNAQLIDPFTYTASEQQRIDAAKSVLYNADSTYSAKHTAYKQFEQQYQTLESDIIDHELKKANIKPTDAAALTLWSNTKKNLEKQKDDILADWEGIGFKTEVEKAKQALNIRKEKDEFVKKWTETRNTIMADSAAKQSGGVPYYETTCLPNDLYKIDSPVWRPVTISKQEIVTLIAQGKQSIGDSVIALFNDTNLELEKISFDVCWVEVIRPWFEERLLLSPFWKLPDPANVVSSGNDSYEGLLPMYPVKIVMVRKVDFQLSPGSVTNESIKKNLQEGKQLFVGPFMLKNIPVNQNIQQVQSIKPAVISSAQLNVMAKAVEAKPVTTAPPTKSTKLNAIQNLRILQSTQSKEKLAVLYNKDVSFKSATMMRGVNPAILATARPVHTINPHILIGRIPPGRPFPTPDPTPTPENSNQLYKVSGTIVHMKNQTPISGAEILLIKNATGSMQSFLTDTSGQYLIGGLLKGNYHMTIKKQGFKQGEYDIIIDGDLNMSRQMEELPEPEESYQLLAVILKKLPKLPSPLPDGVYI